MNYKEALIEMGYSNISETARDYRTRPIYRDSSNNTSLSIDKGTGFFVDYGQNIKGSFGELVKLSMGLKTLSEASKWLSNKYSTSSSQTVEQRPLIRDIKKYPKELLLKLRPDHSYWFKRGVSADTLALFKGGIASQGVMKDRYVFPIMNSKKDIVGFTGRDILEENNSWRPKWKHIGDKSRWNYPLQVNYNVIKEFNEVILLESIGDMLSLWESGVKNTIVTFGIELTSSMLSLLLKLDPFKIIIAFNNDENKSGAGNIAASKARKKLSNHFDEQQIQVSLPPKNDFGEMDKEEIKLWREMTK